MRRVLVSLFIAAIAAHALPAWAGVIDDLANTGAAASAAANAPLRITTRVDPSSVTIGTRFRYTIRIEADRGVEVALPVLGDHIGSFAIADFGKKQSASSAGGGTVTESWYDLIAYETGAQHIPPLPVAYRAPGAELQQIETPTATIDVASLLAEVSGTADVRDIKEAVPVLRPGYPPWMYAAAAAAVAAVAFGIYLFVKRRRGAGIAPARPAHEIALEALDRLRDERFVERGEFEAYYVRLSAVVREYVEARFGVRAPEMTTDEFLAAAQRNRELPGVHRVALQEFLSEADLVKFARHVPSRERAERAWTAARELVETTRPPEEASSAAA